jgi:dienelactone hydrolase
MTHAGGFDVTVGSTPSWLTPLVRLARLDYQAVAAEDSWHRIFTFFGKHLGAEPGSGG